MKQNESSITSLISAFARAYHSEHDSPLIFDDFLAKQLITTEEHAMIRANMTQGIAFFNKEIAERYADDPDETLKWIVHVQLAPITLSRAAYCEQCLLNEVQLGARQYVILGAGLDTFALRYPELQGLLNIYEADHPATQQSKLDRLSRAGLDVPRHLHTVPMDFTHEPAIRKLADAGFGQHKTFFSLLGVSYYLSKEVNARLLRELFADLPAGSSIVLDYADERTFSTPGLSGRVEKMVQMAAMGGEPMQSCYTVAEMESMLADAGLLVYEHLSPEDIQQRYFKGRSDRLAAFETIHFIHAVKAR